MPLFDTAFFQRFVKYLFVGGSAALVNWAVFYVVVIVFGVQYLLGGFVSFVLATLWNFLFAKKFIFGDSKHSLFQEMFLIYIVSFGGLLIDMGVLWVCVEIVEIQTMLSKILATGVAFVFNFGVRHFVIYREQ